MAYREHKTADRAWKDKTHSILNYILEVSLKNGKYWQKQKKETRYFLDEKIDHKPT